MDVIHKLRNMAVIDILDLSRGYKDHSLSYSKAEMLFVKISISRQKNTTWCGCKQDNLKEVFVEIKNNLYCS